MKRTEVILLKSPYEVDILRKAGKILYSIISQLQGSLTSGITTKDIDLNDGTPWKDGYKRQMEIYQWLLRQNGFKVSNTGYFVYVNADTSQDAFDGKLIFDEEIIAHKGDDGWVEKAIIDAHKCLLKKKAPKNSKDCAWCQYREDSAHVLQ